MAETKYTADDLPRGTHVQTPDGPGTVGYVRLAAPDYYFVEAVSVLLGRKRGLPNYSGSMFNASDITRI